MTKRKDQTSTVPAALVRNENAPAPLSADATAPAPAATANDGDTEPVKRKVAKHELLGADGSLLPEDQGEESAHGMRYTLLANNQSHDYIFGRNADQDRMLAVFGAKTLATNETSQARNNPKGASGPDEQIEAVRDRFALLATGTWVDRSREGVGAKIDLDALREAICRVQIAAGAKTKSDGPWGPAGTVITADVVDKGYGASVRQKLDDDKNFVKTARDVPAVATEYASIVGRQTKTVDDLSF